MMNQGTMFRLGKTLAVVAWTEIAVFWACISWFKTGLVNVPDHYVLFVGCSRLSTALVVAAILATSVAGTLLLVHLNKPKETQS